jgi:hypothetical protein
MKSATFELLEKTVISSEYLENETLIFGTVDPSQRGRISFPGFFCTIQNGGEGIIQFFFSGAYVPAIGSLGINFFVRVEDGPLKGTYSVESVEEEPEVSTTINVSGTYPLASPLTSQSVFLLSETTLEIWGGYPIEHPAGYRQPWRKLGEFNVPLFSFFFDLKIGEFVKPYLSAVWDFNRYAFFSPSEDEESSKVVPLFDAVLPVQIKVSSWDFDSANLAEVTFPEIDEEEGAGGYNTVFYFWLATLQTLSRRNVGAASGIPTEYEPNLPFTPILNPVFQTSNSFVGVDQIPNKFIYSRICGYFPALVLVAETNAELSDTFNYSAFIPPTTP